MANGLYNRAREMFLTGLISWTNDDIRAVLVDAADHTVNLASANPVLSDIAGAARVSVSGALTGKTATGGVADAADVTFSAVSGDQAEVVILYKHTGTEASSPLIAAIDTATGLPITPNGGDILVTWDNGANKIFKL